MKKMSKNEFRNCIMELNKFIEDGGIENGVKISDENMRYCNRILLDYKKRYEKDYNETFVP